MPITLTGTAKGQITLRKEVLEHLGARPGDIGAAAAAPSDLIS